MVAYSIVMLLIPVIWRVRHRDQALWSMPWVAFTLIAGTDIRPRRVLVVAITGLGAIRALGWEIGEWTTFIRRGTELHGAYEDTPSDELLGTTGAFVAALIVDRMTRTSRRAPRNTNP